MTPDQLIPSEALEAMTANGRTSFADPETSHNHKPVVKLFVPWASATWLLTEVDPEEPDRAFGLCDLGQGCPELGYVWLPELFALRGPGGLTVERDLYWKADKGILDYAKEANEQGQIIT